MRSDAEQHGDQLKLLREQMGADADRHRDQLKVLREQIAQDARDHGGLDDRSMIAEAYRRRPS